MRTLLLPLLLLAACEDGTVKLADDTGSNIDDTDTAADGDTDTAGDTDTDTAGDTDTDVGPTAALTFVLDGPTDADAVQLTWVSDTFTLLGAAAGAELAGTTVTVDAPIPTTDELIQASDTLWYRYALPFAYGDANGDGNHGDGEAIDAVGRVWALYVTGEIPLEFAAAGVVDGWNAVYVEETASPDVYDIGAIPLPVNLAPIPEATLSGSVLGEVGSDAQLVVIPFVAFEGLPYGALLYNQGLGATWSITLGGEPPEAHVSDVNGAGLYAAIEFPLGFNDTDGDGFPTDSELIGPACSGTDEGALLWFAPPTEPLLAWSFAVEGIQPGWHAVRTDEAVGFVFLTEEESTALVIGGDCGF
jgi:hypothetical protein